MLTAIHEYNNYNQITLNYEKVYTLKQPKIPLHWGKKTKTKAIESNTKPKIPNPSLLSLTTIAPTNFANAKDEPKELANWVFWLGFWPSDEGHKHHLVGVLTKTLALFAGFCLGDFFPGWD